MPFGSLHVPPSIEVGILRRSYKRDAVIANCWKGKWGWMIDESRKLQKELAARVPPPEKYEEQRTIKPIPLTSSAFVGLISSKPEFRLEKYGPDLMPPLPLPEIYNLKTDVFKYLT